MGDEISEGELEEALDRLESFQGRGTPNTWEPVQGFSEIGVEKRGSIYRVRFEDYSFEYRTGRGENFAETLGDLVGEDPDTLDEAARQNYGYIDQNIKAWELQPLTDEEGYLPEHLRDDFEKLYREVSEVDK